MLEIRALTYNGLPPVLPVAGEIYGNGEMIGRDHDNIISLSDPYRTVSRKHLRFTLNAEGAFVMRNVSEKNPICVNDMELLPDTECVLYDDDKIVIGIYVLHVKYVGQASPVRPSTPEQATDNKNFNAGLQAAEAAPSEAGSKKDKEMEIPDSLLEKSTAPQRDPLQMLNAQGIDPGSLDNKGDELIAGHPSHTVGAIDALLNDAPPMGSGGQDLTRPDSGSLDPLKAMFGETGGGGAFGDILQQGKTAPVTQTAAPRMDLTHGSDLNALFQPPRATDEFTVRQERLPAQKPEQAESAAPNIPGMDEIDALLSGLGDDGPATAQPVAAPPPEAPIVPIPPETAIPPEIASVPVRQPQPEDDIDRLLSGLEKEAGQTQTGPLSFLLTNAPVSPPPVENAPPRPAVVPTSVAPPPVAKPPIPEKPTATETPVAPPATAPASDDALYQAFIEGLGISLPNRAGLDKAFMTLLGQLMRNFTQGAVDLIAGRTVVKQAVRANVTVIAPERNNPFKFSPDGNTAILSLLGRTPPGFMGPVDAVQNAFVDLRAHQIGVISGMQAALNHVLDRFDPAELGGNAPAKNLVEDVLPAKRKARLWDEYGMHFRAIRERASDHFQEFFGAAFLEAYEKAILTVQSGERTRRS
ncbi:MAG: type VI secretion system-associated FHA domain protein TagH [Azoarcus sp.]|jgi:type VI secretion system FHA domain protein|nr:type VI secretion system-associated FHA domain protein TagH [Azoarcus sp.]